jgi:hypothetical protein
MIRHQAQGMHLPSRSSTLAGEVLLKSVEFSSKLQGWISGDWKCVGKK